jgi:hypothetical protein
VSSPPAATSARTAPVAEPTASPSVSPAAASAPPDDPPSSAPSDAERLVTALRPQFRRCYNLHLRTGAVRSIVVDYDARGAFTRVRIDPPNQKLADCITNIVRGATSSATDAGAVLRIPVTIDGQ